MEYHIECRCGTQVAVKAEDAGSTVRCECGESVTVPSLSKLRTTAGISSYESGAIDAVQRMLADGTLPWGETCAVSGRPTRDVILINVQCEHLAPPKDPIKFALLLAMCAGPWATLILFSKPGQAHGRDTAVIVPLRVCREYHHRLEGWWGRRKLRRLLKTVPVYARLLGEYPTATASINETLVDLEDLKG